MELTPDSRWEQALEQVARQFEYPPTPPIAGRRTTDDRPQPEAGRSATSVNRRSGRRPSDRRPTLALLLLALALAAAALAAPPTRAALLTLFARVGAISIFIDDAVPPNATIAPPPTALPTTATTALPSTAATPVATTSPVPHAMLLLDLGPPVSLDEAPRRVGFNLRVPTALGEPDEVYVHRADLPAMTLVWRDAATPLTLTAIGAGEFANKLVYQGGAQATTVNGGPAYWLPGPHTLQLLDGWETEGPLIASNVLIWAQDGITYRLEGDLTLDEARVIAESVALPEGE